MEVSYAVRHMSLGAEGLIEIEADHYTEAGLSCIAAGRDCSVNVNVIVFCSLYEF